MTILRKFPWCREYNIEHIKIAISEWNNSVTIYDSFKIKKRRHMKEVIEVIKDYFEFEEPTWLLVAEWRVHNLLYKFNYQPDRTMHVDLEKNKSWIHKILYAFFSIFYFNF